MRGIVRRAGGALRLGVTTVWAGALLVLVAFAFSGVARADSAAPNFTLRDIDGNTFNLTDFRGRITLLDFMYINCASCEIARPVLEQVYAAHASVMAGVSIDILPLDSDASLRTHRNNTGIPWTIARDTAGVATSYGVSEVVRLFRRDQTGRIIFDKTGMSPGEESTLRTNLDATIAAAIRGTAPGIDLQQVSIFALAAIAGVASFFSAC